MAGSSLRSEISSNWRACSVCFHCPVPEASSTRVIRREFTESVSQRYGLAARGFELRIEI
jgi:hypothetical protein